jgi:hypothetical protein
MLKGRFQIKCISRQNSKYPTYQISHESYQGGEFVGSVEPAHLKEFLREKLRLSPESVEALLDEVHLRGHAVIKDVELSETDMASAGMQYITPQV